MRRYRQRQAGGAALITVLLILAVMVVIAGNMASRLGLEVRRSGNLQQYTQGFWYAMGAEAFAKMVLLQTARDSSIVHLGQAWAQTGLTFPLPDGSLLSGELEDLRSCFNLNALAVDNDQDGVPPLVVYQFRALLEALEVDSYRAEVITDSIRNWVRAESTPVSALGATDGDYEARQPPYLAAHGLMVHASELRAVEDVDAALYRLLRPLVCALPERQLLVNVNTLDPARPQLLQALFTPELSQDQASEILQSRPRNGYDSVQAFLADGVGGQVAVKPQLQQQLTVSSRFFRLRSVIETGQMRFMMAAVLQRVSDDRVDTLSRQFGGEQ